MRRDCCQVPSLHVRESGEILCLTCFSLFLSFRLFVSLSVRMRVFLSHWLCACGCLYHEVHDASLDELSGLVEEEPFQPEGPSTCGPQVSSMVWIQLLDCCGRRIRQIIGAAAVRPRVGALVEPGRHPRKYVFLADEPHHFHATPTISPVTMMTLFWSHGRPGPELTATSPSSGENKNSR